MNLKNVFKDALPIIEKFSPSIAGAIGGVPGFALSFVIPLLAKTFNADSHNLSDIVTNIVKDQAAAVKLEGLEHQHHDWICAVTESAGKLLHAEVNVKLDWK
jgi:hypothetical protein